ncbi:MAG: flavodoxin [Bifidobacterium sp.]|nr:flavodoxin [Bifidobacterium sp.]
MRTMKKIMTAVVLLASITSLTACGGGQPSSNSGSGSSSVQVQKGDKTKIKHDDGAKTTEPKKGGGKSLIVYFSQTNTTKAVADSIEKQTKADVFRIEPAKPYTSDYNELLAVAKKEGQDNARPAISGEIKNLDDYSLIYLGTPIWWGEEPMIIRTSLDRYDLGGKTVAPFCTSGGSGCSQFRDDLVSAEPKAKVLDALHVEHSQKDQADNLTGKWLKDNKLS